MFIRRVAVIFDDTARPETTGTYCRRALGTMVEVEHFLPTELARMAECSKPFDLYLYIDDGLSYPIPPSLHPSAMWVIDTHLDFEWALSRAREVDCTFAAQRDGSERLRNAGIAPASWLPLACDPDLHRKHQVSKRYDVSFVGSLASGRREELLELIQREYANSFVGQRYFDEMTRTYSESRLVFNCSVLNDLNMRVFEALGCGSLLITNDLSENGQDELFQDGVHLATYRTAEELLDKMKFYLKHDLLRERIAEAGMAEVKARHTYVDRMRTILEQMESGASRSSTKRAMSSGLASESVADVERSRMESATTPPGSQDNGSVRSAPEKDWSYFEFDRPEVAALVPRTAQRILDVGCGSGRLGASLKARQSAEVTGIELSGKAAEVARRVLDQVIEGNIESASVEFPPGRFDCVICADVIEHFREPMIVLKKIRRWLAPEGTLVASIPNVRNHTVVRALVEGNWTYESAGLLDQDHVRFFTRREIEKLFDRCGFGIESLHVVPGEGYADWERQGKPALITLGTVRIQPRSVEDAREWYVYQYLVTARPARNGWRGVSGQSTDQLFRDFPWPAEKPEVQLPTKHLGWFSEGSKELLSRELSSETRLVVELGAWLGSSTRFIADRAPHATVISIDHWQGSPEHWRRPEWSEMLPTLYPAFLAMNWEYRNRIVPLRMTTREGLQTIARYGLKPDLIFFDAEHSTDAVLADLLLCRDLFPHAKLTGDDYDDGHVRKAVDEFARNCGAVVEVSGGNWRSWRLVERHGLPRTSSKSGSLTSIIIVTFNELAYTRLCVDSVKLRTDEPYELIFVDNGSTDGTLQYLRSLEGATVISNPDNRGFPAAVNQGLRAAKGDTLLLLNNDTVVTTSWLRRMLDAFERDSRVGLIGPSSNRCSGPQEVPVNYQRLESLDGFAWDWGKDHDRQTIESDRLVGFCLLIRRDVIDRIGYFDERFGIGNFEDDDFCRRTSLAGFKSVVAVDAFVHHFGSRTFLGSGVDFVSLMNENRKKFEDKWNGPGGSSSAEMAVASPASSASSAGGVPSAVAGPAFTFEASRSGGLLLRVSDDAFSVPLREKTDPTEASLDETVSAAPAVQSERATLSLCMIVRDNEATIGQCLASARPWVDEIVVVDTGSKDRTPDICLEYGARLFHFPWCDDFAAARNESLTRARGEWLFWMDSDDTLPEACGKQLRPLVTGRHGPSVLGYVMQVHCPSVSADGCDELTVVDHVKLIRNRPDLRFEGRIHEQLLPAIRKAGGDVAWTDLYVVHSGADYSPEGRQQKLERDLRILHQEIQREPEHPFVLFNLGMTYVDAKRFEDAVDFLQRCIRVSRPEESHLRKAYALLISAFGQLERQDDAWDACLQGLRLYPDDKELLFRAGILHHHFGRLQAAEAAYLRVLDASGQRHFQSMDRGIAGHKARHNLGIVYDDMGRLDQAENQWRLILGEIADFVPAIRAAGGVLLRQGRHADLQRDIDGLLNRNGVARREGLILRAKLSAARGDLQTAVRDLDDADSVGPSDIEPLRAKCRLLFEAGESEAAAKALQDLVGRTPEDPSAWHNLGVIQIQRNLFDAAVEALEQSVALRPRSQETWLRLGSALRSLGRLSEATAAWRRTLDLCPNNADACSALESVGESGLVTV